MGKNYFACVGMLLGLYIRRINTLIVNKIMILIINENYYFND